MYLLEGRRTVDGNVMEGKSEAHHPSFRSSTLAVARASQKTGNFTVVAFGGALLFVIVISVSTELFSPNSPTVIFNKAVERLKQSPDVRPRPNTTQHTRSNT